MFSIHISLIYIINIIINILKDLLIDLFKIIDFGRSIFTIGKKTFMNDCFSKHGEAEGNIIIHLKLVF